MLRGKFLAHVVRFYSLKPHSPRLRHAPEDVVAVVVVVVVVVVVAVVAVVLLLAVAVFVVFVVVVVVGGGGNCCVGRVWRRENACSLGEKASRHS